MQRYRVYKTDPTSNRTREAMFIVKAERITTEGATISFWKGTEVVDVFQLRNGWGVELYKLYKPRDD